MSEPSGSGNSNDLFAEFLCTGIPPERLAENLAAYRDILAEIWKLRELDLTDIHPAVVFDAASPFEAGRP